jgi:hypothetical protein
MVANMKMTVFWVVAPCSLVLAASTSETLVNFYQTARRYNPEDSHHTTFLTANNLRNEILKY